MGAVGAKDHFSWWGLFGAGAAGFAGVLPLDIGAALGLFEEGGEDSGEGGDEGDAKEADAGGAPEGDVAGAAGLLGDVGEGQANGD